MVIINQFIRHTNIFLLEHIWFGLTAQKALVIDFIDCGFSRTGAKCKSYLIIFG